MGDAVGAPRPQVPGFEFFDYGVLVASGLTIHEQFPVCQIDGKAGMLVAMSRAVGSGLVGLRPMT